MSEGVKLRREDDDWNPDSRPRELGLAKLLLFLKPGANCGIEEYFSLDVVLSSSVNKVLNRRTPNLLIKT